MRISALVSKRECPRLPVSEDCRPSGLPFSPQNRPGLPAKRTLPVGDPANPSKLKLLTIPSIEGNSLYLVSILAVNTKYRVNRYFFQIEIFPLRRPSPPKSPSLRQPRKRGATRPKRMKSGKKDRALNFPVTLSTGAHNHKRRLVLYRQGFVSPTCATPTYCVSCVWISGIESEPALFAIAGWQCMARDRFERDRHASGANPLDHAGVTVGPKGRTGRDRCRRKR